MDKKVTDKIRTDIRRTILYIYLIKHINDCRYSIKDFKNLGKIFNPISKGKFFKKNTENHKWQ